VAALAYGAAGIAMGTRFLLTSDSTVPDAVKREYLVRGVNDTVVTSMLDGVPQRVLRTDFAERLISRGWAYRLLTSVQNARTFRRMSGTSWTDLVREGLSMKKSHDLSWLQVLMAANTPMMLRASMVDGRVDLGTLASGQVTGVIDDLPSCEELIQRIMEQAHATLIRLENPPQPAD
jgi:NAD(P)H-dependent flavin oxidoreductase YrpB (nitropropane dioxygenase family)